jgi:hypothetical protein
VRLIFRLFRTKKDADEGTAGERIDLGAFAKDMSESVSQLRFDSIRITAQGCSPFATLWWGEGGVSWGEMRCQVA